MNNFHLRRADRFFVDAASGLECLLRANQPLRLEGARGRRIRCTAGRAWITAPGMADDLFLSDGEDWQIDTDGLVLIEAIGCSAVSIGPMGCPAARR